MFVHKGMVKKLYRKQPERLVGARSEGCGNYYDFSRWWRDVSRHGWGITGGSLGKTRKSIYVEVIDEQILS